MGLPNNERDDTIETRAGIVNIDDNDNDAASTAPTDPDVRDLADQEKAQRIEHEDLNRNNKQVGHPVFTVWAPLIP